MVLPVFFAIFFYSLKCLETVRCVLKGKSQRKERQGRLKCGGEVFIFEVILRFERRKKVKFLESKLIFSIDWGDWKWCHIFLWFLFFFVKGAKIKTFILKIFNQAKKVLRRQNLPHKSLPYWKYSEKPKEMRIFLNRCFSPILLLLYLQDDFLSLFLIPKIIEDKSLGAQSSSPWLVDKSILFLPPFVLFCIFLFSFLSSYQPIKS